MAHARPTLGPVATTTPPTAARALADIALAGAVALAWAFALLAAQSWEYWHPQWIESYWCAGAWLTVPLALRRTAPGAAYWATVVGYPWLYSVTVPVGLQSAFHVVPLLLAAFLATRARAVVGWLAGPVVCLATSWLQWTRPSVALDALLGRVSGPGNVTQTLLLFSLAAAATVLGAVFARLDETLASLAERNRELEAIGEVRTREAVQSERVRIARDLHDVVAHHVSAIVVRAQAVARVGGDDVEVYRDAVGWIAPEGRAALEAMRSMVRVLREDTAPLSPASTLADLGGVVDRMRGAGLDLEADLPQEWPPCSSAVGLAVVRVAQEALTNVVSHSAATRARVVLGQAGDRLVLEVTDPGPARTPADPGRGGNGLVHMRERAVACGGTLRAGPLGPAGEGWRVRLEVTSGGPVR